MAAYYNEIDPYAAQWLRNLIAAGHIAPGDVDERSIEDVFPTDLTWYSQCHFFAGIGGWSYALRLAGWPDDRPVWTGSCPCQPFSAAGKRAAFADERHLWPAWHHLIAQCKPAVVFGEQVAAPDGYAWLDLVQTDLEGTGYAFGPVVLPAAGVGAPHGRHRIFFVAHATKQGSFPGALRGLHRRQEGARSRNAEPERLRTDGRLAYADGRNAGTERQQPSRQHRQQQENGSACCWLADANAPGLREQRVGWLLDGKRSAQRYDVDRCGTDGRMEHAFSVGQQSGRLPAADQSDESGHRAIRLYDNGFWSAADWIFCRDGKRRPVEPGTFPLAHGVSRRVDKLRSYGNAIVPQVAEAFIRAYLESGIS